MQNFLQHFSWLEMSYLIFHVAFQEIFHILTYGTWSHDAHPRHFPFHLSFSSLPVYSSKVRMILEPATIQHQFRLLFLVEEFDQERLGAVFEVLRNEWLP